MSLSLLGLVSLSLAHRYGMILLSSVMIGMGSSIFHPEASRVAHMAAGERHGFAQSLFQVGGNLGSSFGPLLAALIIVPHGQGAVLWFTLLAFAGIVLLARVGTWYRHNLVHYHRRVARRAGPALPRRTVVLSLLVLIALIFSKYFYLVLAGQLLPRST